MKLFWLIEKFKYMFWLKFKSIILLNYELKLEI